MGYINIGNRKLFKSGTSVALTMPSMVLKKVKNKAGDEVEVLWDGESDMLVRFKKK